jgi:hypothetical protein
LQTGGRKRITGWTVAIGRRSDGDGDRHGLENASNLNINN